MHLMRTVPCDALAGGFTAFDDAMCDAFSDITGIFPTAEQWARACRGTAAGGCGLRSAHRHWPAAYLKSFLATREGCRAIYAAYDVDGAGVAADGLSAALAAYNDCLPPGQRVSLEDCAGLSQKELSHRIDAHEFALDLRACCVADRAQLQSEAAPGAGDFLDCVPSKVNRLAMRPQEFLVELKRRMLCDIFPAGTVCPFCSMPMDCRGHHCLLCSCGGDRTTMHNVLRGTFANDLDGAGLHCETEPEHLLLPDPEHPDQDERRPAD
eukprot:gene56846-biopygen34567